MTVIPKISSISYGQVFPHVNLHFLPTSPGFFFINLFEFGEFWNQREHLHITDKVVMMGERIVIPKPLRPEIIQSLHAAHQGVTAMSDRARSAVYWPGITHDIELIRASCFECNRVAPSQSKLPPVEPHIPNIRCCSILFRWM